MPPELDDPPSTEVETATEASPSTCRIGNVRFVSCATADSGPPSLPQSSSDEEPGSLQTDSSSPKLRHLPAQKVEESDSICQEPERRLLQTPEGVVKDGMSDLPSGKPSQITEKRSSKFLLANRVKI